jgi:hypothetical protein
MRRAAIPLALLILGLVLFFPLKGPERVRVDFDDGSRDLLSGWSKREQDHTFAIAPTARVRAPVSGRRHRVIVFRCFPALYPSAPHQTVSVFVNTRAAGTVTLSPGWGLYGVFAPADTWQEHDNVITLDFAYTFVPAEREPGSTDTRTLAVAFDYVEVGVAYPDE